MLGACLHCLLDHFNIFLALPGAGAAGDANRRPPVGRLAVSASSTDAALPVPQGGSTGVARHRLATSYVDNSAPLDGELQLDMQGHKVGAPWRLQYRSWMSKINVLMGL